MRIVSGWIVGILAAIAFGVTALAVLGPAGHASTLRGSATRHGQPPIFRLLSVESSNAPLRPVPLNVPLEDVVVPGTTEEVAFRVPPGAEYAMTGILENLVGSTDQTGDARLLLAAAGEPDRQILVEVSLAQLTTPYEVRFQTPIDVPGSGTLALRVRCASRKAFCEVRLLVTGTFEPPSSR